MKALTILLLVLAFGALSFAQAPYLIVFDSSGSMAETLTGSSQTKIEAAKIAADDFIDSTNAEIGLVVFDGCDSGGDIQSGGIQLKQDFTTDKTALKSKIDALSPGSDTPIANALKESEAYIQSSRGSGTIILLTDGEETCGGDPVAAAAAIKSAGSRVHVIGYNIGGSAEAAAKNISVAGGGKYYSANDTAGLKSALTSIAQEGQFPSLPCCPSALALFLLPFVAYFARRN